MRKLSDLPTIVTLVLVSVYGCAPGAENANELQSLSITVTGESYSGTHYGRQVNLERTSSGWVLKHSCWQRPGMTACGCSSGTRPIEQTDVRKLLDFIATLRDGGTRAMCCDHPFTKIEKRYTTRPPTKITVDVDVLTITEIFNPCGSVLLPSNPKDAPS